MKKLCMILAAMLALSACAAPAGQGAEATQVAQTTTLADGFASQYELGLRFLSEGNYQEAILAFTAAIEIDPRRPEAWVGRAQAYVGDGQLEPAAADYEAAIELDGTVAEYYLGLADVYISLEWLDKAIELLKRAVALFTDVPELAQRLEALEGGATDSWSTPDNITGQPPFSLVDLEQWGVPYGATIWDFQEKFGLSDDDIASRMKFIAEQLEENGDRELNHAFGGSSGPYVIADGRFGSLTVSADHNASVVGPRGIRLGMTYQDIVSLFPLFSAELADYAAVGQDTGGNLYFAETPEMDYWGRVTYREDWGGIALSYGFAPDYTLSYAQASLTCRFSESGLLAAYYLSYTYFE